MVIFQFATLYDQRVHLHLSRNYPWIIHSLPHVHYSLYNYPLDLPGYLPHYYLYTHDITIIYQVFYIHTHIYVYIYIHISRYCWLKLIKYFDPSPPDPSKSSLPIGIGISLQEELKHQVNHLPVGKKNMGVSLKRWIYRKMEDFTG